MADATEIKSLLFTHTHPDHFSVGDLFSRMEGYGFGDYSSVAHFGMTTVAINGAVQSVTGLQRRKDLLFIAHGSPS